MFAQLLNDHKSCQYYRGVENNYGHSLWHWRNAVSFLEKSSISPQSFQLTPCSSTQTDGHRLITTSSDHNRNYVMQYHFSRTWKCACKNSSHFLFRGIKQRLFSFKFRSEKLTLLFSQQILVLCPEAPFGQWSQKRRLSFLPPARRELSAEQCLLPEGDRCRRGINWGLLIRRLNRKAVFDLVFVCYPL